MCQEIVYKNILQEINIKLSIFSPTIMEVHEEKYITCKIITLRV